jgi:hypothetical protein
MPTSFKSTKSELPCDSYGDIIAGQISGRCLGLHRIDFIYAQVGLSIQFKIRDDGAYSMKSWDIALALISSLRAYGRCEGKYKWRHSSSTSAGRSGGGAIYFDSTLNSPDPACKRLEVTETAAQGAACR